jgi:hypothetical protein
MLIPKHTTILYMVDRSTLADKLEEIASNGNIITCVVNLREMREPHMNGVVITDWLIVHYPMSYFSTTDEE